MQDQICHLLCCLQAYDFVRDSPEHAPEIISDHTGVIIDLHPNLVQLLPHHRCHQNADGVAATCSHNRRDLLKFLVYHFLTLGLALLINVNTLLAQLITRGQHFLDVPLVVYSKLTFQIIFCQVLQHGSINGILLKLLSVLCKRLAKRAEPTKHFISAPKTTHPGACSCFPWLAVRIASDRSSCGPTIEATAAQAKCPINRHHCPEH
mmetsp:Transcript_92508/g.160715  ORF Transcript_92508/g.160715 Transcript_92508/m.160715 type:complete len:207 (+) Transcript_92508:1591-2211(+)